MYLITWITIHLPTPEEWMAEFAMLADRWSMDSGCLIHKVIIHPASSLALAQDRESSPAETSVLPTLLRRQHAHQRVHVVSLVLVVIARVRAYTHL